MKRSREDHTNIKYGYLTCLYFSHRNKNKETIWAARCVCGKIIFIQIYRLKSGNTKSCGCMRNKMIAESKSFSGDEAIIRQRYRAIQNRKINEKKDFKLSLGFVEKLSKMNCLYCGDPPNNVMKNNKRNKKLVYQGVDRIDSTIGYTEDNCVPCCKRCNQAKNDMSLDEFKTQVKKIYEHLKL